MERELDNNTQSGRLLVQRLQAVMLMAALLLLISWTPWGAGWSVFVSLAPEWQGVPNAVPYLMPHEHFVHWMAQVWAGAVLASSELGLFDTTTAAMLIRNGLASEVILRGLVLLLLIVGWLGAVRGFGRSSGEAFLASDARGDMVSLEPTLGFDSGQQAGQSNAEALDQLAQQQLMVQNMLLDPQAQPVSETLIQLSHNLQGLEQALRRDQSAT